MPVDASLALLRWYAVDKRRLPWRAESGARADPYRVWLSEIMLQQTTVAAVKPYFGAFTARWPTVEALAAAEDGELMAAWAGLGYYARARNLLACARLVANELGGEFPSDEAELRKLPGIGAYTAAAIAAIALRQARGRGRRQCRAGDRPAPRAEGAFARRAADHPGADRCDDSGRRRRRFRAGDDGSGRDDLHAAQSANASAARSAPFAAPIGTAIPKPIP